MKSSPADAAILITMPHSHYAEKARWALDYLALPYVERPQLPLFHRLVTRRHGGTSVPVLAHDGGVLTSSSAIVRWADEAAGGNALFPRSDRLRKEVLALEDQFDNALGPHARRLGYAQLLARHDLIATMVTRSVSRAQARWAPLVLPLFLPLIRRGFVITPQTIEQSRERIAIVFEGVGRLLADGRPFLVGERFTAADLTFAALSAPLLLPPQCPAYPPVSDVPHAMQTDVERWRATSAGRFALQMYESWGKKRTAIRGGLRRPRGHCELRRTRRRSNRNRPGCSRRTRGPKCHSGTIFARRRPTSARSFFQP